MADKQQVLIEGKDFYWDDNQNMVLTEIFLKNRGYCCENGCVHCPYSFNQRHSEDTPAEFSTGWGTRLEKK